MKIFVSGRFPDIKNVKKILSLLKKNGHEIIFDWTIKGNLKPYSKHHVKAKNFSKKAMEAIGKSDIFIFVTHPEVAGGSSVELGAALNSYLTKGKPKVFLVGEYNSSVIFYFHPTVNKKDKIEDVLASL